MQFYSSEKADGKFVDNFDPMQVWRGFQEGNAWQYTFYVPHDVKSLVAKMGADEFNLRLDSIFTISQKKIFVVEQKSVLLQDYKLYIIRVISLTYISRGFLMNLVARR